MAGCNIHEEFNPSCQMCNDRARLNRAAREGALTYAETDLVEKFADEIAKIHQILGIDEKNLFFVSDQSRIEYYSEEAATMLTEILGFKVDASDRLVDVAKRLREKNR